MAVPVATPVATLVAAIVAVVIIATGCASTPATTAFGNVVGSFDDIVGTELTDNRVVSLPCIPSRRDPVGVWIGLHIIDARSIGDDLQIEVEPTEARLGSHPSGCRSPELLPAQSIFLLIDGHETVLAERQSQTVAVTTLHYALADADGAMIDVVVLPTIGFELKNGERQTTIYGLLGRYSLR